MLNCKAQVLLAHLRQPHNYYRPEMDPPSMHHAFTALAWAFGLPTEQMIITAALCTVLTAYLAALLVKRYVRSCIKADLSSPATKALLRAAINSQCPNCRPAEACHQSWDQCPHCRRPRLYNPDQ